MSVTANYIITKNSGEKVHFSEEKLKASLSRTGAANETIDVILDELADRLYNGITTKEIYRIAFSLLKKDRLPVAARYKLKQGVMELGPSGYPFEKFIAEILKQQGYSTQVGIIMDGNCVTHEVDVLAEKGDTVNIIECKYHNALDHATDVKVPLYVNSRFNDIVQKLKYKQVYKNKNIIGWVVTNTDFTVDAMKYGTCIGLKLLSWNYPKNEGLRTIIENAGLYPLTCLTTLTKLEKQRLLDSKIVLCQELCNNEHLLNQLGIRGPRIKHILKEANALCKTVHYEKLT